MGAAPTSRRGLRLLPRPASPLQASLAVAAAAGLVAFLAVHAGERSSTAKPTGGSLSPTQTAPQPATGSTAAPALQPGVPVAVSAAGLKALAASLGHPIYWAGPRVGVTLELTKRGDDLFLRYLPAGVAVGASSPELTVGTYVLANAFRQTAAAAARPDAKRVDLGSTAVGFLHPSRPQSVYFAFPGRDLQIEVYDPDAAAALRLATRGAVRPV